MGKGVNSLSVMRCATGLMCCAEWVRKLSMLTAIFAFAFSVIRFAVALKEKYA